jgi:hypothetical protein
MGLFERRIKPGSDLSNIPTERLLREYAKHAGAAGYISYLNQQVEFRTSDKPVVASAEAFTNSIDGMVIRAEIGQELRRRGIEPPD